MNPTTGSFLRIAATVLATWLIGLPAIWGAFALWYQVPGGQLAKALTVLLWAVFSVALMVTLWQGRALIGLLAFAVLFAALLIWWTRLQPSNDEVWADDVAQMTTGTIDGNRVTLHNVRNFDWRSPTDYTQRWETRTYDLNQVRSVDVIMSYWTVAAIAHMLISFGFDDGSHVVFSVEIRRQKDAGVLRDRRFLQGVRTQHRRGRRTRRHSRPYQHPRRRRLHVSASIAGVGDPARCSCAMSTRQTPSPRRPASTTPSR